MLKSIKVRYMKDSSFVYVMSDGVNHKIGVSKDPQNRVKSVEHSLGRPVSLLFSVNCKDAFGCERALHVMFKEYNVQGEWFRFQDMSFLPAVWEMCMNNIVSNDAFYGEGNLISQPGDDINEVLGEYYVVSYRFVDNLVGEGKYGPYVLPRIMQRLGCKPVSVVWHNSKVYITPKGIEAGLDKLRKKDLKPFLFKKVNV